MPASSFHVVEPPIAASVMVVAAHPDDIESWCAGTLARCVDAGATVRLLLVTSGDKGSSDLEANPAGVGAMREAEAEAATRLLGIAEVVFLRVPDGETEDTIELRREVVRWVRRWRPDVVFTFDPEHPLPRYLAHRDHRIVGRVTLDAVYPLARDPLTFPELRAEGLLPHDVHSAWLFASAFADAWVDISAGMDRKLAARLAHQSQTSDPDDLVRTWTARFARDGAAVGLPYAEGFTILTL